MNERVAALEARFDATLPTLATKSDVQGAVNDLTKWIIGTAVALGATGITVMTFVLNNATFKAAPAQPAPIVVVVPQQPPAASAP